MAVKAKKEKPISPNVSPDLRLPFLKKIDPKELPESLVKTTIVVTIMEVLTSISKAKPVFVCAGTLTKRSISIAKDATKKAKKICQLSASDFC